mgnify:CR=1 FL=1
MPSIGSRVTSGAGEPSWWRAAGRTQSESAMAGPSPALRMRMTGLSATEKALVRHGMISVSDLNLFQYADDRHTPFGILREGPTRLYLKREIPLPEQEEETPAIAKSRVPPVPLPR